MPTRPTSARRTVARATAGGLALLTGVLAACAPASGDDRPVVAVSFYPLQYVVEQVAGTRVRVENLTPPGADPHALELSPAQVAALERTDLVVHLSGFQAAVDEAVASTRPAHVVDASTVVDDVAPDAVEPSLDPHVWLDPVVLAAVGHQVADALAAVDPSGATAYESGADALDARLDALDADYRAGLASCRGATLVTSHEAFGHLARRYGLEQVGIAGIDPEVEPSPARLRAVAEVVRQEGVRTLYFETTTAPGVARTLAEDLGVGAAVLDPLEKRAPGAGDYEEVMRANLEALREGLACG